MNLPKTFAIQSVRHEFPALNQLVYGKPLVYFDNAATTLKPSCVIHEMKRFYENENSNIHRGTHYLSQKATEAFENSRTVIADFLNAEHTHEIIFVRGTTEGINLIAQSFAEAYIKENDEIIISELEHHSNIVPWQLVQKRHHAVLKYIPLTEDGALDIKAYKKLITKKTKIVSVSHVSNALGTINPIREIIDIAHHYNVPVLIDGAQGIVHNHVDVQQLDCDFYCFSGHKLYGPMGIGVVYGKEKWLNAMPPYQGGGEMIKDVTMQGSTWNILPFKFEAGTPNVSAVLGLRKAVEFIEQTGYDHFSLHERHLLDYATQQLLQIEDCRIYGTYQHKTGVISFNIGSVHHYDLGVLLDKMGIAARTGHHCAQPVMDYFGIPGTIRVSFAMYNTMQEIDIFITALKKAVNLLTR